MLAVMKRLSGDVFLCSHWPTLWYIFIPFQLIKFM